MASVDLVSVFVIVVVVVVIVVWSVAVLCTVEVVLFELHTGALKCRLCTADMLSPTILGGVMCLYSRCCVWTVLADLVCVFYVAVVVVVVTTCCLTLMFSIILKCLCWFGQPG